MPQSRIVLNEEDLWGLGQNRSPADTSVPLLDSIFNGRVDNQVSVLCHGGYGGIVLLGAVGTPQSFGTRLWEGKDPQTTETPLFVVAKCPFGVARVVWEESCFLLKVFHGEAAWAVSTAAKNMALYPMETYPNEPELGSKWGIGTGLALLCRMYII